MIKKILHKSKSPNAKVLIENFISLTVLKLAGFVFPLLTLPYLARVLGVENFGKIAFATSVIVFFETLVDYGFNYTATRDVAKNKTDLNYVSKVFSNVLSARIILLLISLIVLLLCIYFIPSFQENKLILLLTFSYIPGYIFFPEWVFQAIEKMKYITLLNLISKIIFTLLVFVVIKDKSDFIYQPILTAIGFFISGVIALYILHFKLDIRFVKPKKKEIYEIIKGSTNMFFSLFLPNLYTNFSVVYLNKIAGPQSIGIYSGGFKFIGIFEQLMQVLSRTFYPFLARRMDKHNAYIKIGLYISIISSISLFFLTDYLIELFLTPEFYGAKDVLKIMSISPFFLFLMNTYGQNYLVLVGKESILRNIILFCSILGFITTILLINKYQYIGVAISITFTWGIRGILTWFFANKHKVQHG